MIKQNRLFEYSYRYRGGKTERKSDREKNDESYRRVRKGDRERVSSIIRLFTSETGCKCYSICLMESLSLLSFLPSSSRVPPRIGIPPNFLPLFLLSAALPPPLLSLPSLDRLEPFEREQLRLLDEVMARERACLRIVEFYIDRARCCLLLLLLFLLPHIFFHVMMEQGDGAKLDTRND